MAHRRALRSALRRRVADTSASPRWAPSSPASPRTPAIRRARGPRRERALIPGPVAFYATLAALLAADRSRRRVCSSAVGRARHGSAEPARAGRSTRDLRPLRVRAPRARPADPRPRRRPPRRGRAATVGDRRRADADRQDDGLRHPRDPRVARAGRRDVDQDATSCARRSPRARAIPDADVWVYDPTGSTGLPTRRLDAACRLRDLAGSAARRRLARRAAHAPRAPGSRTPDFWYGAAEQAARADLLRGRVPPAATMATSSSGSTRRMRTRSRGALDARERGGRFERIRTRSPEARRTNPIEASTRPPRPCSPPTPTRASSRRR